MTTTAFDPITHKATTREQWQTAAAAWNRWGPTLGQWLGPATALMVDLCDLRFERESFGALHQMLAGLNDAQRQAAWEEIEQELGKFEGTDGCEGPCELVSGVGTKE